MTVLCAEEGGVNNMRVLLFVIEMLPPPEVIDAALIVVPLGAYAKVARPVSKGLMVDAVPATALLASGQAASGTNAMSSRKFPIEAPRFALTDSKANRVTVCPAGTTYEPRYSAQPFPSDPRPSTIVLTEVVTPPETFVSDV